jgi:hypothetical protein
MIGNVTLSHGLKMSEAKATARNNKGKRASGGQLWLRSPFAVVVVFLSFAVLVVLVFSQQRKLMGAPAQNSSGDLRCALVCAGCINEVPEKVPGAEPGQIISDSTGFQRRFRRRFREAFGAKPSQVQRVPEKDGESSGEGSGMFRRRFQEALVQRSAKPSQVQGFRRRLGEGSGEAYKGIEQKTEKQKRQKKKLQENRKAEKQKKESHGGKKGV